MVFGIVINVSWYRYLSFNCSCDNKEFILGAALIIYGSYLFLFVKFFVERYVLGKEIKKKDEKKDEKKTK
jgi:hypothetical protein